MMFSRGSERAGILRLEPKNYELVSGQRRKLVNSRCIADAAAAGWIPYAISIRLVSFACPSRSPARRVDPMNFRSYPRERDGRIPRTLAAV